LRRLSACVTPRNNRKFTEKITKKEANGENYPIFTVCIFVVFFLVIALADTFLVERISFSFLSSEGWRTVWQQAGYFRSGSFPTHPVLSFIPGSGHK
jgi:hypothetical protein